ncbi:MAG: zinc ribbon domain-containing protein [Acidithiobacillus sp.]|nr:zinc ribbon domain-containing protein [Acidithiobacillus sp.]
MNIAAPTSVSAAIYGLAKWLSMIIAVIALAFAVFLGASSALPSSSFHVPRFDAAARAAFVGNLPSEQASIARQKLELRTMSRYGSTIISLISKYNITAVKDQQVIATIDQLPREYRDSFVPGWRAYLENGIAYAKEKGVYRATTTPAQGLFGSSQLSTADQLTVSYFHEYDRAISGAEEKKSQNKVADLAKIGMAISALVIFIVAVIVPILVQIEKNTRLLALGRTTAADAAHVEIPVTTRSSGSMSENIRRDQCPQCHAPIASDDLFCGVCGYRLKDGK